MAKIESLPLNVVLQLAKQELMTSCKTLDVTIKGVGFDWDWNECDEEGDCSLMVTADIKTDAEGGYYQGCNGVHSWVMVWDEDECDFHTLMRLDQKENNNKG